MTKKLFLAFSLAMLIASASAAESTNRLHFPQAGFTIAPLESPPGESPQQVLMMFLPASDGFAANVNVQIQPYTGTLEDYVTLSLQQFKSAGLKVLQQKSPAKSVAVFEYTGETQGKSLHWYARAEKSGGSVYLVTATATAQQWGKDAGRLKSCVDSFRCESEQTASPKGSPPRR
jgi:hypothetical protein